MTERKFTDEEIIKALECCYTNDSNDCYKCPYTAESTAEMFCDKRLQKDALDLINRQKAEIEGLTIDMNAARLGMIAEHERLKTAKTEAIKEFAERLKTYYKNLDRTAGGLVEYHIDVIAKEFLGGD